MMAQKSERKQHEPCESRYRRACGSCERMVPAAAGARKSGFGYRSSREFANKAEMGSFGQLVELGKPNFRSGQDGYAQAQNVLAIVGIWSLKQHERSREIGPRSNDRLRRDTND